MSDTDNGFGAPKHSSDRKTFPEGPKEGSTEIRILPPILNQRESGKYVQDHTCHYGHGTKLQGSDKERPNPFYCVEQGKWVSGKFVTTQECPECQSIKLVKNQKERIEASMKAEGHTEAAIAEKVAPLTAWLRKHNRDFKQYVNVKGADGRYFTMKLPQKDVWKRIKAYIEEYKARKVPYDAIAASQGLWFRVNRSGKGFKTDYSVEIVTEEVIINGVVVPGATKPKSGPLTMDDAKKASESCMDIGDVGIRRLSVEQVQRLVAAKGDQAVIAAIFEGSDAVEPVSGSVDSEQSPEDVATASVTPPAAPAPAPVAPVAPVVTAPAAPAPIPEDTIARARALLESARTPAPAAPAVTLVVPPPNPAAPVPTPAVPVAVQQLVADKPTPAPVEAVASTSAAEQSFLDQFKM